MPITPDQIVLTEQEFVLLGLFCEARHVHKISLLGFIDGGSPFLLMTPNNPESEGDGIIEQIELEAIFNTPNLHSSYLSRMSHQDTQNAQDFYIHGQTELEDFIPN